MTKPVAEQLRAENAELRRQVEGLTHDVKMAEQHSDRMGSAHTREKDRAKALAADNDTLRAELHASELRCAELQGYIKALADSEPAPMIPAQMPTHIDSMVREPRRDEYHFGREPKPRWFNRGRG